MILPSGRKEEEGKEETHRRIWLVSGLRRMTENFRRRSVLRSSISWRSSRDAPKNHLTKKRRGGTEGMEMLQHQRRMGGRWRMWGGGSGGDSVRMDSS